MDNIITRCVDRGVWEILDFNTGKHLPFSLYQSQLDQKYRVIHSDMPCIVFDFDEFQDAYDYLNTLFTKRFAFHKNSDGSVQLVYLND